MCDSSSYPLSLVWIFCAANSIWSSLIASLFLYFSTYFIMRTDCIFLIQCLFLFLLVFFFFFSRFSSRNKRSSFLSLMLFEGLDKKSNHPTHELLQNSILLLI